MEKKQTGIKVKLIGRDGNAFAILGTVGKALKRAGLEDVAKRYMEEATVGDYSHLLSVTDEYVEIE